MKTYATTVFSRENLDDRAAFGLAKVGLGMLGIVAEVTLQCVPAHKLVEHTVSQRHVTLLQPS